MTCRYRFGDVILQIALCISVLAMSVRLGVQEHIAWFAIPAGMLLFSLLGSFLNSREREQEKIRAVRVKRQLDLGVPPDEAQM